MWSFQFYHCRVRRWCLIQNWKISWPLVSVIFERIIFVFSRAFFVRKIFYTFLILSPKFLIQFLWYVYVFFGHLACILIFWIPYCYHHQCFSLGSHFLLSSLQSKPSFRRTSVTLLFLFSVSVHMCLFYRTHTSLNCAVHSLRI